MSQIKNKYNRLKPTLEYLSDPVILAQAWKKSHSYIRSHSWYADTLALDASTVNLEENLTAWGKELAAQRYKPTPLRLVPAPKTDKWEFKKNEKGWAWQPANTQAKQEANRKKIDLSEPLRPLAHITIKDQTIATAMMMCMADAVETAQGPTSDIGKVSNYGNRLYCSWKDGNAHFGWGNSTVYSKYFQDYQRFLKRCSGSSERFALPHVFSKLPRKIYEVQLDMSAFYDSINREKLLTYLRPVVDDYYEMPSDQTESFWQTVRDCFKNWQWNRKDFIFNSCLKVRLKNDGLPQGLVASGFFANAYLFSFDLACRSLINTEKDNFIIHDYCRYVDDLRLVISVKEDITQEELIAVREKIIQLLESSLPQGLSFNANKTKFISLVSEAGDTSSQMQILQSVTSGPMDLDSLMNVESSLGGLFSRVEANQYEVIDSPEQTCTHPLACIHLITSDVRDDTVLRFIANRWVKVFKARRKLTNLKATTALDSMQETVARRFIASWARNPSQTLLLKKGLQLFPSSLLLNAIWEPLVEKLSSDTSLRERCIAYYCLAEICRFSATDLRKTLSSDLPKSIDIRTYYSSLYECVSSLLKMSDLPWYLKQQAGLLLVGRKNLQNLDTFKQDKLLNQVIGISNGLAYGKPNIVVPAALVAWQITDDSSPILVSVGTWISQLKKKQAIRTLKSIAFNNPEFFIELVNFFENKKINSDLCLDIKPMLKLLGIIRMPIPNKISDWKGTYPLASVILSNDNPFVHENALIKLALTVIDALLDRKNILISPQYLSVGCLNWKNIQNPSVFQIKIKILTNHSKTIKDPRYAIPLWIDENEDAQHFYRIGCLLRACAIGNCDFTADQTLFRQDVSNFYRGLKSSWYKRRIGMMHSPEALVGETAPMSGWITELLFRLLQWPGIDPDSWELSWPPDINLSSLRSILKKRLDCQKQLYGIASDTPLYLQRIKCLEASNNTLRVITVQSLLPKKEDFRNYMKELNDPVYRDRHRHFLAAVCNLVLKKLSVLEYTSDIKVKPNTNLIVFPELSVHQDDVDLLEALSAKTKAMIFAGIVFHCYKGESINRALWLIPYHTHQSGLRWIKRWQGKWNMTKWEADNGISPWRPYQLVIELDGTLLDLERGFRLTGAICYDATDMKLTSDLRDHSDVFLISALNQDITTFDNMVDALHYHMYQHVILVNTGEFGGSAAKAPFKLPHHRTISQTHGADQISISIFEVEMSSLMENSVLSSKDEHSKERKTKPAGIKRSGVT